MEGKDGAEGEGRRCEDGGKMVGILVMSMGCNVLGYRGRKRKLFLSSVLYQLLVIPGHR